MAGSLVPVASEGVVKLIEKLVGEPVEQLSGMLGDQIRLKRWQNQLSILERAKAILAEKRIEPKQVSLKVLVPLVESASLEDEPPLQEMWARLLAEACQQTAEKTFLFVCTEVLKSISKDEAALLRWMFSKWTDKEQRHTETMQMFPERRIRPLEDDAVMFGTEEVLDASKLPPAQARVVLDNLMRLNLVRYEVPDVGFGDLDGKSIEVSFPQRVHLTHLAIRLMATCAGADGGPN